MRDASSGISIIEVLIVVAIAGILMAAAGRFLNPSGATTRQAAQVVMSAINQARFEAIRTNNTAGIVFTGNDGSEPGLIQVCRDVDEAATPSCATGTVFETIRFSASDLARAQITNTAPLELYFDRRGIVRNQGTAGGVVTIADRSGNNVRTVTVLPTGRAEIQ
jgi:type IV fimbrial biogenesis protein FimT